MPNGAAAKRASPTWEVTTAIDASSSCSWQAKTSPTTPGVGTAFGVDLSAHECG